MTRSTTALEITGRLGDKIYQRVDPRFGNVPGAENVGLQIRRYTPTNPNQTPAQVARHDVFRNGVSAYHLLSANDVILLRMEACKVGLTAFNLFMSRWLKSN